MTQTIQACNDPTIRFVVDAEDYAELAQHQWEARAGLYAYGTTGAMRGISMHRYLVSRREDIAGRYVDHKNRDVWDNRKINLRVATASQNQANQRHHRDNTSGYRGIYHLKRWQRWTAQIRVHPRQRHLGNFDSAIEAAVAYDIHAQACFGEFATLNFVEPPIEVVDKVRQRMSAAKTHRGKSAFYGVSPYKDRWRARIWHDGGGLEVGYFPTEEMAARAVDAKLIEIGSDHRLNFPS